MSDFLDYCTEFDGLSCGAVDNPEFPKYDATLKINKHLLFDSYLKIDFLFARIFRRD